MLGAVDTFNKRQLAVPPHFATFATITSPSNLKSRAVQLISSNQVSIKMIPFLSPSAVFPFQNIICIPSNIRLHFDFSRFLSNYPAPFPSPGFSRLAFPLAPLG
jgi:hypothetical protein